MLDITELSGQWIGKSQPDGSQSLFSIVNIEKRSPGKAQVIGTIFYNDQWIRQCNDGQFELSGDLISGSTSNFRVFDPNTDRLIPLAHVSTFQGDEIMLSLGCGVWVEKPINKWLKNVFKSHIKLVYRLVCIVAALGTPIIIIGWIAGGYVATYSIITTGFNSKPIGITVGNIFLGIIIGIERVGS